MSNYAKIKECREKSKEDLMKQLTDFKKELSQLRVAQHSNTSQNDTRLFRIRPIRKSIARILTVLNQKERANLKKFYSERKMRNKAPKAIRTKLTHRRRLALSQNEKRMKTRRQIRMAHRFPPRTFAVKL